MAVAKAVIEVEFEAADPNAAKAALIRLPGDINISLSHGSAPGVPTHVNARSIKVLVRNKSVDGQQV